MMRILMITALSLWSALGWSASNQQPPSFTLSKALAPAPRSTLPALDMAVIHAEDAALVNKSKPWRYAVGLPASGLKSVGGERQGGVWSDLADGRKLWRFEVEATGAKTVDLHFMPYRLPHGAELWLYTPDRMSFAGPYTDLHNNSERLLATPALPGARVIVEVVVPADRIERMQLALHKVYSGYRGFEIQNGLPVPKSGSCNVDTICPQGDGFRNEIQSVVRYAVNGGFCTATLMNNVRQDGTPLLLTARHCFANQSSASAIVVSYNYASANCRTVNSGNNGIPIPLNVATHTQTGSTLLASATRADFTLVRLNQAAPPAANLYFAGWDRRNLAPAAVTGIHHPAGDEKRISFENDPLSITTTAVDLGDGLILQGGEALRVDDWDLGTTEPGSSGSAIFSPQRLVVGTLSGGFAACGNNLEDYYGTLAASFVGGGTASTRLQDHLDPGGSGLQTLSGFLPGNTGACNLSASIGQTPSGAAVSAGTDVRFSTVIGGGTAPYSLSWDVDGDGVADEVRTGLAAGSYEVLTRYNRAQSTNVSLTVNDSAGCQVQTQRAVDVDSSDLAIPSSGTGNLTLGQVCGDGDNQVEPGEHWSLNVRLLNNGLASANNGSAIFRRVSTDTGLRVVNPAVSLPTPFVNGQSSVVSTQFYIEPATACTAAHSIQYVGIADDRGVSGSAVNITIPVPTSCAPVAGCAVPAFPGNTFRNGSFFNPSRGGNGLVSYLIPRSNAPALFYAQWFTADDNRRTAWYYFQEDMIDGQASGAIVRRTRNLAAPGFATSDEVIGTGQITILDNERLVFTHQLIGKPRGGDRMVHLLSGLPAATPNRTGAWFFTSESGWGQTYDSFVQNGVSREFALTYVYDNAGQPRWVSSGDAPADISTYAAISAPQIVCPTCAWVPPTFGNAGTITRQFTSGTTGSLSTNFTVPVSGSWQRSNVPIVLLTTPQP